MGEFRSCVGKLLADNMNEEKREEDEIFEVLATMIDNPEYGDVLIHCGSRFPLYGNRVWLMTRCPAMRDRISNGNAGGGHVRISFPNTTVPSMRLVLEYLYVGTPVNFWKTLNPVQQRNVGRNAIEAAELLDLRQLVWMLRKWLRAPSSLESAAADKEDEKKEKEVILKDLSKMLDHPSYCDMGVVCRGEESFLASSLWLKARLAEFRKTFSAFLDELGNISRDTDSQVMWVVLQYLYTGSPQAYIEGKDARERWDFGLDVIIVSLSLRLKQLERIVWEFLTTEICSSCKDMKDTIYRLSHLQEFQTQRGRERYLPRETVVKIETVSADLVRLIERDWLNGDHVKDMSRRDFLYFLSKSQTLRLNDPKHRLTAYRLVEYLRLRSIIRWCVWEQSADAEVRISFVSWLFPKAQFTEALHDINSSEKDRNHSYHLLDKKMNEIVKYGDQLCGLKQIYRSAKFKNTFLPFVNLELIHPAILEKIVKPWDLINASLMAQTLRKQKLSYTTSEH